VSRELNILKQCFNPLNVIHIASSKKNLRPVLDWIIKTVHNVQNRQRINNKCRNTIANVLRSFGNEVVICSSSEYDK
jgi:hypothetical protein